MTIRGVWAWLVLIALFLSLGANFFLGGFLIERARAAWIGGGGPPGMARVLDDFPPQARRMIGRELWRERGQFRAAIEEIGAKRRQIAATLREPNLDIQRVRALMDELRALSGRMQERAQEAVLDAIQRMEPSERARIGEPRGWGRGPWRDEERRSR